MNLMTYEYFKQFVTTDKKVKKALFMNGRKKLQEDEIQRAYALYIDCNTPKEEQKVDYEALND